MAKSRKGFTLAEVLITLVVIGIIAAITVPMIMANHKKTETASKLKKFYSTMSNAIKLSELENGLQSYEWTYSGKCNYDAQKTYLEKYILPYLNYMQTGVLSEERQSYIQKQDGLSGDWFSVYFNDGSMMYSNECPEEIAYDVNGDKGPNEFGRDIFAFYILYSDDGEDGLPVINKVPHFNTVWGDPIPWESDLKEYTREKSITSCKKGGSMSLCSHLLEIDGWEFKDDYPLRL